MELTKRETELVRNVCADTIYEVTRAIREDNLEQEDLEFLYGYVLDLRKMVDILNEDLGWDKETWEEIIISQKSWKDSSFVIKSTSEYNMWLDRAEELNRPQLEELLKWNQMWMSELLMEWVDLDEEEQVMDDDTSSNIWILKQDRYRLYKLVENRE